MGIVKLLLEVFLYCSLSLIFLVAINTVHKSYLKRKAEKEESRAFIVYATLCREALIECQKELENKSKQNKLIS